jgi:hypothetical protein
MFSTLPTQRLRSVLALVVLFILAIPAAGQEDIPTPRGRQRLAPQPMEQRSLRIDDGESIAPMWTPGENVAIEMVPEEGEVYYMGDEPVIYSPNQMANSDNRWEIPSRSNWQWTIIPDGLIYKSYLAGPKEARFRSVWAYDDNLGWIWDITLGGRVGLLRFGSTHKDDVRPEGWQLDIEGAAFPRLDPENERDLVSADFRFGIPLTYGIGRYQAKFAYYHLSSHIGDEYLIKNPTFVRRNYVRDELVWGNGFYLTDDVRLYGEIGYAFYTDGGADPLELQTGIEYSPAHYTGFRGAPFAAINGLLRQEFDFGGLLVVQAGWQWRGEHNRRLVRFGGEYSNGKSEQFEFYDQFEQRYGLGMWFDY